MIGIKPDPEPLAIIYAEGPPMPYEPRWTHIEWLAGFGLFAWNTGGDSKAYLAIGHKQRVEWIERAKAEARAHPLGGAGEPDSAPLDRVELLSDADMGDRAHSCGQGCRYCVAAEERRQKLTGSTV